MAEIDEIFPINIWFYISCFDENVFQTLTKTSKTFRQFAAKNEHLVYKKFGQVQLMDEEDECGIGFKWVLFGEPNRLGHLPIKLGEKEICWNVRHGKPSFIDYTGTMEMKYGDCSILIDIFGEYKYVEDNYRKHFCYHVDQIIWLDRKKKDKLPDIIGFVGIYWYYYEPNCVKSIYVNGGLWFGNRKNNAPGKLNKDGTFE